MAILAEKRPSQLSLESPISDLKGVTPAVIKRLHKLKIQTVWDLLFHFPFRYDDFSNIKELADVAVGEMATVRVVLKKITATRAWKKRMFIAEATLEDESGTARAVWFNQPYLAKTFRVGEELSISGKLTESRRGPYFANPAYERLSTREVEIHTAGLVPVYPETSGITSRWIRFLAHQALPLLKSIKDPFPETLLKKYKLPPLAKSLSKIHFPEVLADAEEARRRFAFEDIFLIQLRVLRDRQKLETLAAPEIPLNIELIKTFVASLPFALTNAQRKAAWEIVNDLARTRPMNRLLEGDVGSGKTVVAALAALNAVSRGFQVAYLAPTEILALQHFSTFKNLLSGSDVALGLLSRSQKKLHSPFGVTDKANLVKLAADGDVSILIGTHAIVQEKMRFKNLGLIIVDEQHRFGVSQRAHLQRQAKRLVPHFLSMTATPIPRTLALTVYGDLDVTILDQYPKGRKPTITKIVPEEERKKAYQFIREEVRRGRQIFVICPRIEIAGHDEMPHTRQELYREEIKAVKSEYEKLKKEIFPDLKIAMLHGKMKPQEKEIAMREFKDKKFDILVSTSVIEVGVDVPNATIMLIDGAEKFGLAQIHQFRGRVGRGEHQSYCFLMTSSGAGESARLRAVVTARNGFELAEKDLEIRGPGDFFGTKQSGIQPFAYKAFTDMRLIQTAREAAQEILEKDPALEKNPELKKRLEAFEAAVHFE